MEYAAPFTNDEVPLEDILRIAGILWFARQAVFADAGNELVSLERYFWNVDFYWGVIIDARASRVWQDAITADDIDLFHGPSTIVAKRARKDRDVYKELDSLPQSLSVEASIDV